PGSPAAGEHRGRCDRKPSAPAEEDRAQAPFAPERPLWRWAVRFGGIGCRKRLPDLRRKAAPASRGGARSVASLTGRTRLRDDPAPDEPSAPPPPRTGGPP